MNRAELRKKAAREIKGKKFFRAGPVEFKRVMQEGAAADAPAIYECPIASEEPVERWWGMEVLDFSSAQNADLTWANAAGAVLLNHSADCQIGVIEKCWVDVKQRRLMAQFRFSRNPMPQEIERDWVDGVRRNVSIGYGYDEFEVVKGEGNAPDVYRLTKFPIYEMSIVPIPADPSVGQGRAFESIEEVTKEGSAAPSGRAPEGAEREEKSMLLNGKKLDAAGGGGGAAAPVTDPALRGNPDEGDILRLAMDSGISRSEVDKWIAEGWEYRRAADEVLKRLRSKTNGAQPGSEAVDAANENARKGGYSIVRALRAVTGLGKLDGAEAEFHQEALRLTGRSEAPNGGVILPWGTRAMDTKTPGSGADLVADTMGPMIHLLSPRSRVIGLGAQIFTGLRDNVQFPKITSGASGSWVGENPLADVSSSQLGTGFTTLSPKMFMANIPISRQLLAQTVDSESMVRNEIARIFALAVDKVAVHGKGTDGEPLGIYTAGDVQTKDFTSGGNPAVPDYAGLVDMIGKLGGSDVDLTGLAWILRPEMAATFMRTLEASAAGASWIMHGNPENGTIAGYKAVTSTVLSKTLGSGGNEFALCLGCWPEMKIGFFGPGLEVIVDPLSLKKRAMLEFTGFQMLDIAYGHGEGFVKALGSKA